MISLQNVEEAKVKFPFALSAINAVPLNDAVAKARTRVKDVRAELIIGSPLHSIIDYAQKHKADLIVIGTHVHGAVAALLIGSVAEGLVRKAMCPTLVIPCAP